MLDKSWSVFSTLVICFFVTQIANIPFTALPMLAIGACLLGAVLMLVFFFVTLPGLLWASRRHSKK